MTQNNSNGPSEQSETSLRRAEGESVSLPQIEQTYDDLFAAITKLDEDDLIVRTNCKFCTHPERAQAEFEWEKSNGSFSVVQKYFDRLADQDPSLPRMTYLNIRNHIWNHYKVQERKVYLREYSEKLRDYMNYKINVDKRYDAMRAVLELQLFELASNPALDPHKRADSMSKLMKMEIDIDVAQQKLRGEVDGADALRQRFMNVWLHRIGNAKDENTRKILMEALDDFQADLEGVSWAGGSS